MNVILFGATGMVGQGVLRECLSEGAVENVLAIGRRSTSVTHPKLRELLLSDIFSFDIGNEDLHHFDACFFCLGISSAGMSESDYRHMTLDLTIGWAQKLAKLNPMMTFIYVSGAGTGGRSMWAQIKGQTESALLELFPKAYMHTLECLIGKPEKPERPRAKTSQSNSCVLGKKESVLAMMFRIIKCQRFFIVFNGWAKLALMHHCDVHDAKCCRG